MGIQASKIAFNEGKEEKRGHWDQYHQTCKIYL